MIRSTWFPRPALALLLSVAWSVSGCGPSGGQEQEGAPPTEAAASPDYETTQVADGVWKFRWQGHNGFFVSTPEGVVVVDPISTEAAAVYASEVQRVTNGAELLAVVYSHRDADHATGAEVLREALGSPDAPIVAHGNALEPLTDAADPDLPAPTRTYEGDTTLAESTRPIELHHPGPSHSDDQSIVLVPDAGVAFAVDFVSNDRVGYRDLPGWHMPGQIQAIESLLGLEYDRIVFGHGPDGDRAVVERQLGYYQALADAVSAAIAEGLTEDQAAEQVRLDEYSSWDSYDEWFPLNVRGMYRLLSEG